MAMPNMTKLTALHALANDLVNEGIFCTALQVSVDGGGSTQDIAVGQLAPGMPVGTDTLFSVHCATKPLVAMAIALLVDDSRISLDDPVGAHVRSGSLFERQTDSLLSVLTHAGRLGAPQLLEVNLCPDQDLPGLIADGIKRAEPGYSEYVSQAILSELIEAMTIWPRPST